MDIAFSTIGEGSEFSGHVIAAGAVSINGVVRGRVTAGSVILGERAVVEGPVRTRDIFIGGSVVGYVIATGAFVLAPGGSLVGDVYRNVLQLLLAARRLRPAAVPAA